VSALQIREMKSPTSLAVALGANLPSAAGTPRNTLVAVRPLLQDLLQGWAAGSAETEGLALQWSPLFETAPVGGPAHQPPYVNAVVVLCGIRRPPQPQAAVALLDQLHELERRYGRDRNREERWGPRTLDLDLLFWEELRLDHPRLTLPHPRLHLRTFVLEPLLAALQGSVGW
jgi:2-amino-4-hydroxy-6-hydroxymethyldihydropteridine diphosphokinase